VETPRTPRGPIIFPPYEPPDVPPDVVVNMPAPHSLVTMLEKFGAAYCASTLGRAGANMDGFYFDVCNLVKDDQTGRVFQDVFGNVPRNSSVPITDSKTQLGFTGGVLDSAYTAGVQAGGGGGYVPKPIGKLKDLQEMFEKGRKPRHDPEIPDVPDVPYESYFTPIDRDSMMQRVLDMGGVID